MDKDEELKNSELQQQDDMEENEGEDYADEQFDENHQNEEDQMEGEGDQYDQDEQDGMNNPYNQNNAIRNTFYPSQNPMMGPGYGGALRPVSANIIKDRNRKAGYGRMVNKKGLGLSRGVEDEFDVRTRPRNFVKDKEGLYDDAIKLKKANNTLK